MTKTLSLDASCGFVALPLSVMELELSPGAFRTLAELCRMADRDGWCWPSLAQLAERLGRSRAAISGYVGELRAAELVETEQQRTANGYNYRLRYRVTFWAAWRQSFGRDPERRVRPTEHRKELNQIQTNQDAVRMADRGALTAVEREWRNAIGRAPYPSFERAPAADLVSRTVEELADLPDISADIRPTLREFCGAFNLPAPSVSATEMQEIHAILAEVTDAPALFAQALRRAWKSHWRRAPDAGFLTGVARKVAHANPEGAVVRLLRSHLRRWECARNGLPRRSGADTVAPRTAVYPRI